jgi:hypothetical protein
MSHRKMVLRSTQRQVERDLLDPNHHSCTGYDESAVGHSAAGFQFKTMCCPWFRVGWDSRNDFAIAIPRRDFDGIDSEPRVRRSFEKPEIHRAGEI